MKINIFVLFLVGCISQIVYGEDSHVKLLLLNKDVINEDVKEIKNSKITLVSGAIYDTSDSQEIFIKEKTDIGSYPLLLLNNGSMIYTKNLELYDNLVTCIFMGSQIKINCDLVKGVLFKNLSKENSNVWKTSFVLQQRKSDLIFVMKEDKLIAIEGVIREIDKDKVKIQWEGQDKSIALDKIIGILFATVSDDFEVIYEIICVDGSKLRFYNLEMKADGNCETKLNNTLDFISISKTNIHRILFNNRKTVFLSENEPVEEVSKNILIFPLKNWEKDQNIWKKPLAIGGKLYANGLGVHSTCHLKYFIPDGSVQFISDYGIDDCVVNKAGCIFKVLVDKKEYLNESVNSASGVKSITIDLPLNCREITLVVDSGLNLDIGDLGVWGSARFIKK
jgi:hypothetical protein